MLRVLRSLGYHKALLLSNRDLDRKSNFGVLSRLSYKELTKTNNMHIYPTIKETCDLSYMVS